MVFVDYWWVIFYSENEILGEFLVEWVIENANWPWFVTDQVVNQITLLVNLIIKKLITHGGFLYTAIHEKLIQKVQPRFPRILGPNPFYSHLIHLLVLKSGQFIIFSVLLNFFVFELVFWKIRHLDYAICILKLCWDGLKNLHYVLKTIVAHYLRFHHMENRERNPEKYFGAF